MARVLCVLILFTIIGVCAFASAGIAKPRTVPIPAAGKHAVHISSSGWSKVTVAHTMVGTHFVDAISVRGGVYADCTNGINTLVATHNDRAVYRSRNGQWSIYYRVSGYMRQIIGCWTSMM